jgi:hypothetical protein
LPPSSARPTVGQCRIRRGTARFPESSSRRRRTYETRNIAIDALLDLIGGIERARRGDLVDVRVE